MTAPTVVETAARTLIPVRAHQLVRGLAIVATDGNVYTIESSDKGAEFVGFTFTDGSCDVFELAELVQMVVIRQSCPRWCVDCSTDSDGVTRHGGQVVTLADGAEIQAVAYTDPDGSVEPTTIVVAHPDGECVEMPLRAALYLGAALRATAEDVLRGGQR